MRVVRQPARFFSLLPHVRWLTVWALIAGVLVGGWRWLGHAPDVGALAFTPHVVGTATNAPGVKEARAYDFNGDGRLDIVTSGNDGLTIYENGGNWTWETHEIANNQAERLFLSDIDSDGDSDLVITLRGNSPSVQWYENTGDFTFTARSLATTGSDAVAAVGDINNDDQPDIVTASVSGDTVFLQRWINNGNKTFTATTLSSDSKVTSLVIGDIIRDDYADIVTGGAAGLQRWSTTNGSTWTRVDIDDGNENRSHLAVADNGTSTWIATADANDDEVVLYRSGPAGSSTEMNFGTKVVDDTIDAKTVSIVDMDRDDDLDLLVAAQDNNEIYWFSNDGMDNFTRQSVATGLQSVFGAAAADIDGDTDLDVLTGDHVRGTVYVYERLRKKPTATAPDAITQASNGSGYLTFTTAVADEDGDPARIRLQYSLDGEHWYKPWLVKVDVDTGKVDLENRQGYQVGTKNSIDTSLAESVNLTLTWDTKSSENTGGPLIGDRGDVLLRVLPRDTREGGIAAVSKQFRVDNAAPTGTTLRIDSMGITEANLSWTKPADSSGVRYEISYGTNRTAVLDKKAEIWGGTEESPLADIETTTTTITDLQPLTTYYFKLFATDDFGNVAAPASVAGTTISEAEASGSPTPTPTTTDDGDISTPTPTPIDSGTITSPTPTPTPTGPTPTPSPTTPTVLLQNVAPLADAGADQVVNPRALVILDGTASYDPDPGDSATLTYNWRQLSGPTIDFLSERTATPSFSAGGENETYVFLLTVHDLQGASAIDTVTIATKPLPESVTVDVEVSPNNRPNSSVAVAPPPSTLSIILLVIDLFLLALSLLSTAILLLDRVSHVVRARVGANSSAGGTSLRGERAQSRVVHYKTGAPIAGATVLVYAEDGKLRAQERTNAQGAFASFFPVGTYTLGVRVDGFTLAQAAAKAIAPADSIVYAGGKITVKDANHPPSIIIPLKPTGGEVTTLKARLLHNWQAIQYLGRVLSWPLFFTGAILNTVLVFWQPSLLYLVIEMLYIVLVIVKIAVEIRLRPAYGLVRDAITHIPLELAVVRLLEQGTNRLVMTRVTNNQGKFFALPPAGTYTITISKPGYGTFTKEGVEIVSDHDTTLQMMADLMPVSPSGALGGLARARAATI